MGLLWRLLLDQFGIIVSLVSVMFWTMTKGTNAYNIDITDFGLLSGAQNSSFGASVALWSDLHGEKMLAVGAPRGEFFLPPNMSLPLGNLYVCSPKVTEDGYNCSVVESVPKLSARDKSKEAIMWAKEVYEKYGIGLGETLFTNKKEDGMLLVCAPRFPRKNGDSRTGYQLQPRGACFEFKSLEEDSRILLPYQHKSLTNNRKKNVLGCQTNHEECAGFAQAGFSVASVEKNGYVYLGGPSAFSSQGVIASMKFRSVHWRREVASKVKKDDDTQTSILTPIRNSLEGWATVSGKFDGKREYVATSLPGYDHYRGMVKIYSVELKPTPWSLEGQDMGSGYGFSLAAGDFNGDNKDDLAVAAPFAKPSDVSLLQDVGKVIVYFGPFDEEDTAVKLDGTRPWGRFGHAMACLGDIDLDGFDDLAIGAPYAFEGRGAVYIYNGNTNGIRTKYSQEIRASSFGGSLFSFGYSLDGGLDIDGNGYKDLLVGAPITDNAVFLRSAPVISLNGRIEFDTPLVSLNETSCKIQLQNELNHDVVCFKLIVNIQYEAKHVSDPMLFRFDIKLDEHGRIAFEDNHRNVYSTIQNVSHVSSEQNPLNFTVYVKPNVRRFHLSSDAEATLEVSLPPVSSRRFADGDNNVSASALHSVISAFSKTSFSNSTSFECPYIDKCLTKSDLILTTNRKHMPLMVAEGRINVEMTLEVHNNTAYSVKLILEVHKELEYLHHQSSNSFFPAKVDKKTKTEGDKTKLHFEFPSELPRDTKTTMNFTFGYTASLLIELGLTEFDFNFQISADTDDLDINDNTLSFSVPIISRVNLEAEGWSIPESVKARSSEFLSDMALLNSSHTNFSKIPVSKLGPRIAHSFRLINRGPSPLINGKIVLGIPLQYFNLPLMYLADGIETSENIRCSEITLNPLNFSTESDEDDVEELANGENKVVAEDLLETREGTGRKKRSLPIDLNEEYPMLLDNIATLDDAFEETTTTPTPKPREEEIKKVDCNSIPACEEIRCEVYDMMADKDIYIKINGYVSTGSLKILRLSPVLMESSLAFYTNQKNVFLNQKQANDEGWPQKANIKKRIYNPSDDDLNDKSLVKSSTPTSSGINQSQHFNASDSITAESTTLLNWDLSFDYYHSLNSETTEILSAATNDVTSTANTDALPGNNTLEGEALTLQVSPSVPTEYETTSKESPGTTNSVESVTSDDTSDKISTVNEDVPNLSTTETLSSYSTFRTSRQESVMTEEEALVPQTSSSAPEEYKSTWEESLVSTNSSESSISDATSNKKSTVNDSVTILSITEGFRSYAPSETSELVSLEGKALPLQMSSDVFEQTPTERDILNTMDKEGKPEMPIDVVNSEKRKYDVVASTKITVFKDHTDLKTLMQLNYLKIIIGVTAALMLIICICAILYKIGFFERKRLTEEQKGLLEETIRRRQELEKYY